jgi:O-antigen/teichoic acid export membrane protein
MDLIGISKMIRGLFTVPIFGLALYFTDSLVVSVISLVLVWLSVFVLVDCRNACKMTTSIKDGLRFWKLWSMTRAPALVGHAIPLGIVSMLISYNHAVPRYFLEAYHDETALGYFSAIAYLPVAITILVEALGQAALPKLAKYYEGELGKYWRSLLMLFATATGVGCLGVFASILIGEPLLSLVYRPEYGRFIDVLVLVMVLGLLEALCSVLGVGLMAARVLRYQVPVLIIVLSTSMLAGWWLIPQHAIKGAVWTSIVAATAWVGLYALGMVYLRRGSTRSRIVP